MTSVSNCFLSAIVSVLAIAHVSAQEILFQTNFDNDDGLVVLPQSDDSEFTFGYDYEIDDTIPEAPNSALTGGAAQTGLKLEANLSLGADDSIAVATDELGLTGRYSVQVDVWLNYNFPAGTAGTTEFGGLSVGHDGETGGVNGASFLYDTDGDTARDYRLYKDADEQVLSEDADPAVKAIAGQFAVASQNNSLEPFVTAFPEVDIGDTVDQAIEGFTSAGSGGFRWMTIEAIVDTEATGPAGITDDKGFATFSITEPEEEATIEFATVDNSNGQGVVDLTGDVAMVFRDIFSSVSNDPFLSFGIFDNLIISSLPDDACDPNSQGDLDGNGTVEFTDFLILSGSFGNEVADHTQGDIDCNGTVEFADFLVLSGNFGQSTAGAQSVPEPRGFLLLGVSCLLLGAQRRRRL